MYHHIRRAQSSPWSIRFHCCPWWMDFNLFWQNEKKKGTMKNFRKLFSGENWTLASAAKERGKKSLLPSLHWCEKIMDFFSTEIYGNGMRIIRAYKALPRMCVCVCVHEINRHEFHLNYAFEFVCVPFTWLMMERPIIFGDKIGDITLHIWMLIPSLSQNAIYPIQMKVWTCYSSIF